MFKLNGNREQNMKNLLFEETNKMGDLSTKVTFLLKNIYNIICYSSYLSMKLELNVLRTQDDKSKF